MIIKLNNIYKSFEIEGRGKNCSVNVIENVNLEIEKNQFVSIMGPSGSGKSTLLYMMGGIENPSSGEILIDKENIVGMKDEELSILRREKIGFVFQFYNLIPNLTVEENMMVPILISGKKMKKYEEKAQELLELVGLIDRRNYKPGELSGGQQQRVAVARALMNNPSIILADEPIGNLDSASGKKIMEFFREICDKREMTIVQATHSYESSKYGDRVIYLRDGKIVKDVKAEELSYAY